MTKREQEFVTKLQKWMAHNMKFSYSWEVKIVYLEREKSLSLTTPSTKKEIANLTSATTRLIHKFSDFGGMGTIFDGITMWNTAAFFFIQFYKPREKKFYVIEISEINKLIAEGAKSINEKKANEIAYLITYLA